MSGLTGCSARIHLLGPVSLVLPDGRREVPRDVRVGGSSAPRGSLPAQLRKVLAVLAIARDVPLSAEQIVKRVWDGDPPESAIQMVRNQIRSLRQLFAAVERDIVVRAHGGYRLATAGLDIDAEQFRTLVRQGRSLHAAGHQAEAVRVLERGLALWHGQEALVDVRDVPGLQVEAVGLEEMRFHTEEMVAEGHLALGRPEDALPVLRAMTLLHPSREWPWLLLMAAQTLVGRRIEASGVTYRQAQHHLVEKTGLDAPLLARVHQALLRGSHGQELLTLIKRGAW